MDNKKKDITKVKLQRDLRPSGDGETPGTSRDVPMGLDVNSADDIRFLNVMQFSPRFIYRAIRNYLRPDGIFNFGSMNTTTSLDTKRTNSQDSTEMDSQPEIETQNAKIGKNKKNDTTFDSVRIVMQLVDDEGNKRKVDPMKNPEDKHDDKKTKRSPPRARERATKKRRGPRRKPAVPKKRFKCSKATSRTPGMRLYKKRREFQIDSASESDIASVSSLSSDTDSLTD